MNLAIGIACWTHLAHLNHYLSIYHKVHHTFLTPNALFRLIHIDENVNDHLEIQKKLALLLMTLSSRPSHLGFVKLFSD